MSDPWKEMDDWCVAKSKALSVKMTTHLKATKFNTSDPDYRVMLGQHKAFSRMRSYIHGAKAVLGEVG